MCWIFTLYLIRITHGRQRERKKERKKTTATAVVVVVVAEMAAASTSASAAAAAAAVSEWRRTQQEQANQSALHAIHSIIHPALFVISSSGCLLHGPPSPSAPSSLIIQQPSLLLHLSSLLISPSPSLICRPPSQAAITSITHCTLNKVSRRKANVRANK